MICAFCTSEIDQDSFYCDICGEEIKTCPECKKPGKAKVCTSCGKVLILAKSQAESLGAPVTTPLVDGEPSFDIDTPTPAPPELRLINKNIAVDLKIDNNSIIGRTSGQYVDTFGSYSDVSSRHCRFNYDTVKGWTVTDLDSKYHTIYNNRKLIPNVPQPISDGSYLKIAGRIEFFVRIIPG